MDPRRPPDPVDPMLPPYAGAADEGVVSSVPEHDPSAGDVVDVLRDEHDKLGALLAELREQLAAEGPDAVRPRWGGFVREALEHAVAEERVVWEVLSESARRALQEHQQRLRVLLTDQDSLHPDVTPDRVDASGALLQAHARQVTELVLPELSALDAAQRMALGEDFRQVMG